MNIRALIAEDEWPARAELAWLLQREKDVTLCPAAETGDQLLALYDQHRPDVIFLDIQMPGLSGMEAARRLLNEDRGDGNPPLLVFTTAYEDHAVEAFALEAVDYLLKPYDEKRFKQALGRIRKRLADRSPTTAETLRTPASPFSLHRDRLLVDHGEKMVVLSPTSISYAVRVERLLEIHTEKEILQSKMTLQELEDKLREFPFFRTHRSYLVNLEHIREITPWFNGAYNLVLKDENQSRVPVSRSSAKRLFQLLGR
ncbi:LytR/AlgR family response regulator transcription factor [Kroppenstedtia eburnea]|uniref:Two component transcriptional regulator, LytTR family n=1 Tax=Kroppenstedtia eburnea TaxID=714067 RepID=A0A1N7KKP7_9BACL|nr:LytTR family DNA-binding domain-containing protein [Kroppenstedtia eburnea]EGK12217.1 DNA-binding response regulator [Desmospora sp. 8437]QKI82928.1 response regulator transcription factor [Kroppenstedtia eburnea]SIS62191.1 two component transcriptional regulator, LytTR family [Kroppenstedtia eburnea]